MKDWIGTIGLSEKKFAPSAARIVLQKKRESVERIVESNLDSGLFADSEWDIRYTEAAAAAAAERQNFVVFPEEDSR